MFAPLVILLEIDSAGVAIFELERDAPRSIDVDRVAFRVKAVQSVKVEAGDIHFLGAEGDVETVQPRENALLHFRINLRTLPLGPQLRKGLALESSYHVANVSK
jgi:hypothetical protein